MNANVGFCQDSGVPKEPSSGGIQWPGTAQVPLLGNSKTRKHIMNMIVLLLLLLLLLLLFHHFGMSVAFFGGVGSAVDKLLRFIDSIYSCTILHAQMCTRLEKGVVQHCFVFSFVLRCHALAVEGCSQLSWISTITGIPRSISGQGEIVGCVRTHDLCCVSMSNVTPQHANQLGRGFT